MTTCSLFRRSASSAEGRFAWLLVPLLVTGLAAACNSTESRAAAPADEPAAPAPLETSVAPGANERFLDPELDVEHYVSIFEGESREIALNRDALTATAGLRPGMDIADVGAGTGLFLQPFASAVAPGGTLYAVDISPGFVEHMTARAAAESLDNVVAHLGGEREVGLPAGSIDVAFVCDTYHHFEYPESMLASLRSALRPKGRLIVVDFERIPGVSREWTLDHVRAGKETFRAEIEAAGFVFEDEPEIAGLEENYVLRFRRP